jgi:hypothetical protein
MPCCVRPLTFNEKRLIAGVYGAVFLIAAGNHYLEWGLFGDWGRPLFGVAFFLGVVVVGRYGAGLQREVQEFSEAQSEREMAAELRRDKSSDAVDAEKLSKALGVPPNKSLERSRER